MDPFLLTAAEAAAAVRAGQLSARELTALYLSRCAAAGAELNAFTAIFAEAALHQAEAVDEAVKRGVALPLAGVPVTVKDDLYCREGPTGCGCAALHDFRPPGDAAAVCKLREAGAVVLGKTNLDQLGLGTSTATSAAGPCANPWDRSRVAGDGGAAAVAAGQALLAVCSDTAGELRIGASACGLFGLLPTPGLVSRYGLITAAPSFARVGLIARNSGDALLALEAIAGPDPRDAATLAAAADSAAKRNGKPFSPGEMKLRAGFPAALFELLDEPVQSALEQTRAALAARGVKMVEITLPLFGEALQAYTVIAMAEASSNLSRFDGIRFGSAASGESDLEQCYRQTRFAVLGAEGIRRSIFGTVLLSGENYDRYYRQARRVWALLRRQFLAALEKCDLILLPAVSAPAGRIDAAAAKDFLEIYRENEFCAPVSLSGLPALTIPAGTVGALPVGMQLVGPPFGEALPAGLAEQIVLPRAGAPAPVPAPAPVSAPAPAPGKPAREEN